MDNFTFSKKSATMSYCRFVQSITSEKDLIHKVYHDRYYGFPLEDDNQLFGRLILEINQAGLSWATILRKEAAFQKAFDGYQIIKIARYKDKDIQRLLSDEGIIRNRLKIQAVIYNAGVLLTLQQSHGSFKNWLDSHHPLSKPEWVKLFKKTFKFTGGEITGEFLMSTGYLPGAHDPDCPIMKKLNKLKNLPLNKKPKK
ncbi:DNA-3-methyladenine glycosylase I [Arachidicoccus rhizosphaerae]|jgi:DNA-3-methyladenine glycosylase I|nr:DNA-3-methyladenine glycosylase I [Arachidicoccus rhizosphaerae]